MLYKTYLNNNFTILALTKKNDCSFFTSTNGGISVQNNFYSIDEKLNNFYNIICVHGYSLDYGRQNELDIKKIKNLSCDDFVIDFSGEADNIHIRLLIWDEFLKNNNISYKRKKIITPIDVINFDKKDWEVFTYPFSGPRFFCDSNNNTFHNYIEKNNGNDVTINIIGGVKWNENKRDKLYICLNNTMRPHRIILVNKLLKYKDYGYLTAQESEYHSIKIPELKVKIDTDDWKEVNNRFKVQSQFINRAYVNIITETIPTKVNFVTEKSIKPFLNLEFPIIFGHSKIIQYFRNFGFDMFDDIINHSYDDIEIDNLSSIDMEYTPLYLKSKLISEEIERLTKLDMHKIYLECKDRLIANQKRIYELTIENNNRTKELIKWIFEDNAFYEINNFKKETIYI